MERLQTPKEKEREKTDQIDQMENLDKKPTNLSTQFDLVKITQ